MRRKRPTNQIVTGDASKVNWKRRPSEIRGYNRALYVNAEGGDYIRVDYNLKDGRVRIYIEDGEEGGNPYYAVISDGRITAERNVTTGRSYNLSEKFNKRAQILSTIPNNEVIKLINKNYGIGEELKDVKERQLARQRELEETRKRYFREHPYIQIKDEREPVVEKGLEKVRLSDFFDVLIGLIICILVYLYGNSFIAVGIVSAVIGVLVGILDIFFRVREPLLVKNLIFIIAGVVSYIYGYYFF
jgi:hypothetical protein